MNNPISLIIWSCCSAMKITNNVSPTPNSMIAISLFHFFIRALHKKKIEIIYELKCIIHSEMKFVQKRKVPTDGVTVNTVLAPVFLMTPPPPWEDGRLWVSPTGMALYTIIPTWISFHFHRYTYLFIDSFIYQLAQTRIQKTYLKSQITFIHSKRIRYFFLTHTHRKSGRNQSEPEHV